MTTPSRSLLRLIAALSLLAAAAGCGGGGGGGGGGGAGPPPPPAALRITPVTMNDGLINASYSFFVVATGGTGQRTFSISVGALPPGLAIDASSGQISGTALGPLGVSNFTATVRDSGTPQQTAAQAFSIRIVEPLQITTASLPEAAFGVAYNQSITAAGGVPPYTFNVFGLTPLPDGLTMNGAGAISGQATFAAITRDVSFRVVDNGTPQREVTRPLTIAVPLEIVTTTLPDAEGFEPYLQTLVARGGRPPYFWGFNGGTLPNGAMNVFSSGAVTGTPNGVCSATTSTFSVFVRNNFEQTVADVQTLSLTVNPLPLVIRNTALPGGLVGFFYFTRVRTQGGALPFSFSTIGALPAGLGPIDFLDGRITGTPTTPGVSTFNVNVSDGCAATQSRPFSIAISQPGLGRNDSIGTATPLGNGEFAASLSPSGPSNAVFVPDQDYYAITTTGAETVVRVEILAQAIGSPLDPVVEFVDANGVRLNLCVPPNYISPCMNDDIVPGTTLDSRLLIRVANATTFYARVVDWRGDARPDYLYRIEISGIF